MKKMHCITAVAAMIFLITALLFTSFQAAIYGDPEYKFYEKEYDKYKVADDLDMEMPEVMKVTDYMMAYLIGQEKELSIQVSVGGETKDFFNEQDRLHMADVKNLFLGGLKLRWILLGAFFLLIGVLVFLKADWKKVIPRAYFISLGVMGTATALLGALFASDFNRYFTIFHEIFFTNDLWMFDPATDLMIRMLPEGFFFDMVMRIGAVFISSLIVLTAVCLIWRYIVKKDGTGENTYKPY